MGCQDKALGRKGWLDVRKQESDPWIRVGGVTTIDQTDAENVIPCDDFDTVGQVPYTSDLAEVTSSISLDYMGRDPGQIIMRNGKRNGTLVLFRYAQELDEGSDKEMQEGVMTVETWDQSNAKGELATISVSVRQFAIDYKDQSLLPA